MNHSLVQANSL